MPREFPSRCGVTGVLWSPAKGGRFAQSWPSSAIAPILLDISQETLAEMIGTTRSRVSFFMNKFRKLGLIGYNGKIEVHNSLLNAVLHEKPEIERDDSTGKV